MGGITRDFSMQKKLELRNTVLDVGSDGQFWLFDEVGDIVSWFSTKFGDLQIENYLYRMDTYHQKIIDQKDMTMTELLEIFANVTSVNNEYAEKFRKLDTGLKEYIQSLSTLSQLINPKKGVFTPGNVKKVADMVNTNIDIGSTKINAVFDAELDYMEIELLKKSGKEFVGDVLSLGGNVLSFAVNVGTGDVLGAAKDIWKTLDSACTMFGDVGALAGVAVSAAAGGLSGGQRNNRGRKNVMKEAEEYGNIEGITGMLKKEGFHDAAKATAFVDVAADVYDLFDSAKDIVEGAGKLDKVLTDGRYNKAERLKEMAMGEIGFKDIDTPYKYKRPEGATISAKVEKWIRDDKNVLSNINKVYKYTTNAIEGTLGEEIFKTTSLGGFASDYKELLDETGKLWCNDWGLPSIGDIVCGLN